MEFLAYWRRAVARAWGETVILLGWRQPIRAFAIAAGIAVLALLPYSWRQGNPQAFQLVDWWLSLGLISALVVGGVFAVNLVLAPHRLSRDDARQIATLDQRIADLQRDVRTRLEFTIGDGPPFSRARSIASGDTHQMWRTFYVGVKNADSRTTIGRVHVQTTELEPSRHDLLLPIPHSLEHEIHERPVYEFALDPGETKFVVVCTVIDGQPGIGLSIRPEVRRNIVESSSYRLTLTAYGENVPPCTARFSVSIPLKVSASMRRQG